MSSKPHTGVGNVSAQIAALPTLQMAELWTLWNQHFPRRPKHIKPLTKQALYKLLHNRMYLGEINHKGQNYPGHHHASAVGRRPCTDRNGCAAAQAGGARRGRTPAVRPAVDRRRRETGAQLHQQKGKRYCYYTPVLHRRMGAWASKHGSLPAEPIEALVTEQLVLALQAPLITQMVVDRMRVIRPDIDEPQVVLPMRNLAAMWPTLYPAEQRRLAQLLIDRVMLGDDGLEIVWRDLGWQELVGDLLPGTIGAELQELQAEAV